MSLVHVFVCDYCGNQNQVYTSLKERRYNEEKAVPCPSPFQKCSEDEDEDRKIEEPILYLSVNMDIRPIRNYEPNGLMKCNDRHLSFCGKSCFIDFFQKNLNDAGRIKFLEEEDNKKDDYS